MADPKPTIRVDEEPIATGSGSLTYRSRSTSPEPTIRVEGVCRGDGRCPECGEDARGSSALACGCRVPGALCVMRHLSSLLTEALRQRQMDREFLGFPGEDGVKPARAEYAPEMDTMETLAYVAKIREALSK